jgi:hypothetical protein
MANRRNMKKDINHLCYEVIYECITFLEHTPSLNQENVYQIISDAVELRNNLIFQINNAGPGNPSSRTCRLFYKELKKDMYNGKISMIERLNSLPR